MLLDYLKNRDKKGKSIAKVITPNNKLYVLLLLFKRKIGYIKF